MAWHGIFRGWRASASQPFGQEVRIKGWQNRGNWLSRLGNPPATYRGAPFWSWNAKLDRRELVRQVGEFKRAGFGGFFMHVRYGLETEYLSPEFMDDVKAVVAEAKRQGLEAWMYDDDRWCSGYGGGRVTGSRPEYAGRSLCWEAIPADRFGGIPADAVRCFSARVEGQNAFDIRPLRPGGKPGRGRVALVYCVVVTKPSAWYNFTAYVDVMNPEAIRAFIQSTHEVYRKAIGSEFGKTVPGIFTDEPHFGAAAAGYPWTGRFAAEFKRRMGYDILDRLVEVTHRVEGASFSPARRDYRRVATELFVEAYSRQIGQWCGRHRLESTGHLLHESLLQSQADSVGACMPHFEWFQRPGVDVLCDKAPEILTLKQAASVASQLGRPRVLSELFGCMGWDATFEAFKHVGDWHLALGVNHFCPHLSWYSMAGGAKRDYPPSIFFQSPWWRDYGLLGDYFGRLCMALAQGQAVREVCVLHPIETAWGLKVKPFTASVNGLTELLYTLFNILLDRQIDFDLADESLLDRHGTVEGSGAAARLRIGAMRYRAVLVPESATLRRSTVSKLRRFAAAGGRVVFAGTPPERVDGQPAALPRTLLARAVCVPIGGTAVSEALGDECRPVAVEDRSGAWHEYVPKLWIHLRKTKEGELLFVINRDQGETAHASLRWTGQGRIYEVETATGKRRTLAGVKEAEGRAEFPLDIPPTGSRLFLRTKERPRALPAPARRVETQRVRLASEWDYRLDEPNALTLDNAWMRVIGTNDGTPVTMPGRWRPKKLLWKHEADLSRELGFPDKTQQGEQPYLWLKNLSPRSATVEIEFDIRVEQPPSGGVKLALERPERFEIAVNGQRVPNRPDGWFVDRSVKTVPLKGIRWKKGNNVLRLATTYRQNDWMEDVYLLGRFGVRAEGPELSMTALPRRLGTGDWCRQGLAMYSGAVTYAQTVRIRRLDKGERAVLRMDRPKATVVRVAVNGQRVATLGWEPWEADITRALRPGSANRIELTLVSSRRNLLGPFHHKATNSHWTGPDELRPSDEFFDAAYRLVSYGLMGEVYVAIERALLAEQGRGRNPSSKTIEPV